MTASGAANPNWRGGRRRGGEGRAYWLVYAPHHPAAVDGAVLEHRLVMEEHLGRLLQPSEIVHHRNGNTSDNRIENLELMTQAEHARLHMAERVANGLHYIKPTERTKDGYWSYRRGRGRLSKGAAA